MKRSTHTEFKKKAFTRVGVKQAYDELEEEFALSNLRRYARAKGSSFMMSKKFLAMDYKIILLAGIGGSLEFFDFTIYALFACYLSLNFFPQDDHLVGLINTFAIFAVGYFARPLGGIIFGHFGDKYGRKGAFTVSALVMAFATLLMGCIPTYQQIGLFAPLLLLILRILQGISVGEVPGAIVFTAEHVATRRPGFAIGIILMAVTFGNVIGGISGFLLTHYLTETAMIGWGWRIPFVIGFFLGLVAYILRKKTLETPVFQKLLQELRLLKVPAFKLLRTALPRLILGASLTALPAATVFLFLYLPSYPPLHKNFSSADLYLINLIIFSTLAIFTAVFGFIADYVGRRILILVGPIFVIIFGYHFFANSLLQPNHFGTLVFGLIAIASTAAIVNSCYTYEIVNLFPGEMRYSGMAIAYNFGFAIFGGLAPLVVSVLLKLTQSSLAFFYFLLACSLITFLGILIKSWGGFNSLGCEDLAESTLF